MQAEEKAKEVFTTFQQYYWADDLGWMPDEDESKKMAGRVIDEIERQAENWGITSVKAYWKEVRLSLNAI